MSDAFSHPCPYCQCYTGPDPVFHPFCPDPNAIPVPKSCPDRSTHIAANWDAFYATFAEPEPHADGDPTADTAYR